MKRNIAIIITFGLIFGITYFLIHNTSSQITLYCPFKRGDFTINYYILAIMHVLEGLVLGLLIGYILNFNKLNNLTSYKKRCEKLSVQGDSDDTRIKALETKIKTLEIALKNALKKN